MAIDFNDAEPQREFSVIPDKTIVPVVLTIRPGGAGEGGWATKSRDTDAEYLSCELTVTEGPFLKRKFWQNLTVSGGKRNEKGESIAWNISKSSIRAMLNSARGISPDDDSETARRGRVINNWGDLNGLPFLCMVGIEPEKNGYPAKNKILQIIEPGHKAYGPINYQAAAAVPAPPAQPPAAPTPSWAAATPPPVGAGATAVPAWAR